MRLTASRHPFLISMSCSLAFLSSSLARSATASFDGETRHEWSTEDQVEGLLIDAEQWQLPISTTILEVVGDGWGN